MNDLTFDRLLEILAEKLASKLSQEPNQLYPRLMTIDQAAVYLGQTRETIRNLITPGKIPTVLVGTSLFIDRLDLDEWIEENKLGWSDAAGRTTTRSSSSGTSFGTWRMGGHGT